MNRYLNHPATRGALTGLALILTGWSINKFDLKSNTFIGYLPFLIYALGIGWSLWTARSNPDRTGSFGDLFQQGFRHFAATSLVMVIFTIGVLWRHPEYAREEAEYQRTLLIETKKYTPDQINELVVQAEKQFPIRHISATVFGYLFMGAIFTAVGSMLLARKK